MADDVWISSVLTDPDLVLMMETDIVAKDAPKAIEALSLLNAGKPVPAQMCPRTIWPGETAKVSDRLPDLFLANAYPIVSERGAAVLRQFDLGGGSLHAVETVLQKDRQTPILSGTYYCWVFGNTKAAFSPEQSSGTRPFAGPNSGRWKMPFVHKDDQLAVSAEATGGPDVWVDPTLFKSVFLSGRLGEALTDVGLAKAFRLFRCRVVSA
jgi:hypothetical protein